VDIPGQIGATVFAVQSGYVKSILTVFDSDNHWRILIGDSSGTAECDAWMYAHITRSSIPVSVGDHVAAGDPLGTLVIWPDPVTPIHLHLSRVRFAGDSTQWADGFWDYELTANPLHYLDSAGDTTAPFLEPALGSQLYAICSNESSTYFDPGEPISGQVDIVCSAYDYCNYAGPRTGPYRMEYRIRGDSSTPWIVAFEFGGSIGSYNGSMEALSHLTFKYDHTCSTYYADNLLAFYIMTNTDGDGILEVDDTSYNWNTAQFHNGEYYIISRVSDFEGNATVDSMPVTVDNSYSLSGHVTLEGVNQSLMGTEILVSPDALVMLTPSSGNYGFPDVGGGYQHVIMSRAGYVTFDTLLLMDRNRQVDVTLRLMEFVCGNTNGVPPVNSADIIFLVNYVFKSGAAPMPVDAGNANGDASITSADLIYLINYVFKSGTPPVCL
jgi:hypothetical protein